MRFTTLLPAFLAATVATASPDIEAIIDLLAEDETHVFKRDADITARDVDLAERNGVDLNSMYKHSIVKRDDGDHITIWVDKSFEEFDAEDDKADNGELETEDDEFDDAELEKRQEAKVWHAGDGFSTGGLGSKRCIQPTYRGDTGPNAPFTGGANAIISWASRTDGIWSFHNEPQGKAWNLMIAGSNRGANMRFAVALKFTLNEDVHLRIGSRDVGDITRTSRDRYQQNHNGWRVRAHGSFRCQYHTTVKVPGKPGQISLGHTGLTWTVNNGVERV